MLNASDKIFVAGHRGMVGSAIVRQLQKKKFDQIITRTHAELDLCDQAAVRDFMGNSRPDVVILAAAKVGGIHANDTYPAEFIYENLIIEANIVHEAWRSGCKRLLFLGSSCIYPRLAVQPMAEDALLTGPLESTNEPYAIAKIAGIKLCESYNRQYGTDFRSAMPTNLYGQNDNFHPQNSHVIPALLRRFHEAKIRGDATVTVWGSGNARREFLHVDDMAAACIHILSLSEAQYKTCTQPMLSHINVGSGRDDTIRELTAVIADVVGFTGEICWDASKPDGAPRKLMDVKRLRDLGWSSQIDFEQGLRDTYRWYLDNQDGFRH